MSFAPVPSNDGYEPSARFEFPKMLYAMLEDCTFDEELFKIVSWQPHGLAFKVHNREEMEKILPKWFREKYESWRCLLEQWGFLKLSRGKDRGCWYHKNFVHRSSYVHSRNKYEQISKKDFLEGMPDYLSPREEPDLDNLSILDNRISPKQRKRKADALRDIIDNKNAKVGKTSNNSLTNKNRSNLKHIGVEDDEGDQSAPPDMIKCRFCKQFFNKHGIARHETACMRAVDSERKSGNGNEDNTMEYETEVDNTDIPQDMGACKYCGKYVNKYGLGPHEKYCKAGGSKDGQKTIKSKTIGSTSSVGSSVTSQESGCQVCGFDDDHANLLLCEGCETEIHTYCLNPPLEKVPEGDWFCDTCSNRIKEAEASLGKLIRTVPSDMMDRFGEICFAKSAENAHWWPALIFDPRSFLHNAEVVELARKNLGKRFLVFYFENQDAFAAIPKTWIMSWEEGIEREFDKGKSVKHASSNRRHQFQRAMDAAKMAFEDDSVDSTDSPSKSNPNGAGKYFQMNDDNGEQLSIEREENAPACKEVSSREWQLIKQEILAEADRTSPSRYPTIIDDEISKGLSLKASGKWQAHPFIRGKSRYLGMFANRLKGAFAIQLVRNRLLYPESSGGGYDASPDKLSDGSVPSPTTAAALKDKHSLKHENSFGSFVDKKPRASSSYRSAARTEPKLHQSNEVVHSLQQTRQESPEKKKKLDEKKSSNEKMQKKKELPPPRPTRLKEHERKYKEQERNELLSTASFCNYYILPLSQI